MTDAQPRFRPGDHIRVRRLHLYWHHGICISNDRVVEFGGGGLAEKYRAVVHRVSLQQFEKRGTAEAVSARWPKMSPAGDIIARAEYLCACPTKGMYNLLGANCEHLARWCVESDFWSYQVATYALPLALFSTFAFLHRRSGLLETMEWLEKVKWIVAPLVIFNAVVRRLATARWKRILNGCPLPTHPPVRRLP